MFESLIEGLWSGPIEAHSKADGIVFRLLNIKRHVYHDEADRETSFHLFHLKKARA